MSPAWSSQVAAWIVGSGIQARYWVTMDGDYYIETTSPLVAESLARMKSGLPRVFRSSSGKAEIYDLSPVIERNRVAQGAGAASAAAP